MRSSAVAVELVRPWAPDNLRRAAPGVALCAAIAAIAFIADFAGRTLLGVGVAPVMLPIAETAFIGLLVMALIYGLRSFGI